MKFFLASGGSCVTWISFHPWRTLMKRLPVADTYVKVPSASPCVCCIMASRVAKVFGWTRREEEKLNLKLDACVQLLSRQHVACFKSPLTDEERPAVPGGPGGPGGPAMDKNPEKKPSRKFGPERPSCPNIKDKYK